MFSIDRDIRRRTVVKVCRRKDSFSAKKCERWQVLNGTRQKALYQLPYPIMTPGLLTTGIRIRFDSTMLSGRNMNFLSKMVPLI